MSIETAATHVTRHKQHLSALLLLIGIYAMGTRTAFAQADGPDPTKILDLAVGWVKDFAGAALTIIVIISFVVAAYAALVAISRFISGKGEWGGMLVIFLVALMVTVFVGQLAYEGNQAIEGLEIGDGG